MKKYHNFKKGDKVKVLYVNEFSKANFKRMRESVGKILTITTIIGGIRLNNGYWYDPDWLWPIKDNNDSYASINDVLATL